MKIKNNLGFLVILLVMSSCGASNDSENLETNINNKSFEEANQESNSDSLEENLSDKNQENTQSMDNKQNINQDDQNLESDELNLSEIMNDDDYQLYEAIMDEYYKNFDYDSMSDNQDEEIFTKIGPQFDMTSEEIKNFLDDNIDKHAERKHLETKEEKNHNEEFMSKHEIEIKICAKNIIENEIEKHKMKGFSPISSFTAAIYDDKPVYDQQGEEYPLSFSVIGKYEEKGTGLIRDFNITLGYKDVQSIENFSGTVLQYLNEDTDKYYNIMDPESDLWLKLMEFSNQFNNN